MSEHLNSLTPALDNFERYYTEKIWDWIPPFYRDEDGLADNPDVLRSMVAILAQQAAIARRSTDRLWEDPFIELCDDWAISYLGDLLGTRLVHELNRRGRRVDVARTVFYRRRKGTPVVLERLTQDITGWEGTFVESFRRLARTRHGLDPELFEVLPDETIGSIITPPGGWANLKSTAQAQRVNGPFDGFTHTPDFRQLRGKRGRYNIPKLNIHLYRLSAFSVQFATAVDFGEGRFTFDPSGREIPLFRPDQRGELEDWRSPQEWEFPAPIPCRLLGDARYQLSADLVDGLNIPASLPLSPGSLSSLVGVPFRHESRLRQTIQSMIANFGDLDFSAVADFEILFDEILADAIAPISPKAYLVPSPVQVDPTAVSIAVGSDLDPTNDTLDLDAIAHQRIVAANLADWGASLVDTAAGLRLLSPQKEVVIDPVRGRFWFPSRSDDLVILEPAWVPIYHYGLAGDVGAGTYDRRENIAVEDLESDPPTNLFPVPPGDIDNPGPVEWTLPPAIPRASILQFDNSKTYTFTEDLTNVEQLIIQADTPERPYLRHVESAEAAASATWQIEARSKPDPPDPEVDRRTLTLEGLWIGVDSPEATPGPLPRPVVPSTIVLAGNFDQVIIRHCTLDPGGEQTEVDGEARAIPSVRLVIQDTVESLLIESSIVGPILEDFEAEETASVAQLTIRDSVVHSLNPAETPAIQARIGSVKLERVTVFGDVLVKELHATEALIQGLVTVANNQRGCFRFSATHDLPETRLPPQFESHLFEPEIPNLFFTSQRFGDPGYAQLSDRAPDSLLRGGENRAEIGVFNLLLNPIKRGDLSAKVSEFIPFGLIPQFINET
ncbi:MAG: hypothetical protein AAGC93_09025 [Cyanobacteria bacterium P01_F01_bin.53]